MGLTSLVPVSQTEVIGSWNWKERKRDGEGCESLRRSSETCKAFTEGLERLLCQICPRELR
jgi:hypothetical protein